MFRFRVYVRDSKTPIYGTAHGQALGTFECPKCGNRVKLRKDGAIRKHRIPRRWNTRSAEPDCPWSGGIIELRKPPPNHSPAPAAPGYRKENYD